ncbi:hypothetical protein [Cryobacterium sp. AP23]
MSADGVDEARPPGVPTPGRPGPRPTPSAPTPTNAAATVDATPAPPVFDGDLKGRIAAVEALPLEDRAAAYTELHDSLRDHLEGGDVPRSKAE